MPQAKCLSNNLLDQPSNTSQPWHTVQFYESEDFLIEAVCLFISRGLKGSDGILVIATQSHIRKIDRCLTDQGIDLKAVAARGQGFLLDAKQTCSEIMDLGVPDIQKFNHVIRTLIQNIKPPYPTIRVYGELADLCVEGSPYTSVWLEQAWNLPE